MISQLALVNYSVSLFFANLSDLLGPGRLFIEGKTLKDGVTLNIE